MTAVLAKIRMWLWTTHEADGTNNYAGQARLWTGIRYPSACHRTEKLLAISYLYVDAGVVKVM